MKRAQLILLLALGATGCSTTSALAARGHEFTGAFGWGVLNGASELQHCAGEPAPNCQPGAAGNGEGQFDDPVAIAVNEASGNLYVVDKNNDRVEIFNASGSEFIGEFDGSGLHANEGAAAGSGGLPEEVPTGKFDEPEGIAVDNSCALRHLAEPKCKEEDPSNGDVYVVDTTGHKGGTLEEERMVIDKFDSSGKYLGQITRNLEPGNPFSESGFRQLFGVAVDPRGEVWVEAQNFGSAPDGASNYTNALMNNWVAFHSTEDAQSAVAAPGFAVDGEDNLYVHNTFGTNDRLAKFSTKGEGALAELISAEVDEEPPTGVAVELASGDVYISHETNVHRVGPSGSSLEALSKVPGTPSFSGVAVNSATLTVYAAETTANRIDVFGPEAPGAPTVQEGSTGVTDVTASSASFTAEVNPRSEENEAATSYAFQYGPCESASSCPSEYPQSIPAPEGILAANYEPDAISAHPQGLQPHTVYHMRVEARNSHGQAFGEEVIFTTQGTSSPALPDARQWELVSPPDKHGAAIRPSGTIQAAAGGDAISYLANAPSEANPAGFSQAVQILSRRTSASWRSADIATPHEAAVGVSIATDDEYQFFSEDLSSALLSPFGPFTQAVSPQGSERTIYLRSNFPAGDPSEPCTSSCYRPLTSGCPGGGEPCPPAVQEAANVPEGTKFGTEKGAPSLLGASPDASHVIFTAYARLTEDAPPEETNGTGSLYEWADGKLTLVSVLPGGQAALADTKPALGSSLEVGGVKIARHAISPDGSRVVWSAGELDGSHHLTGAQHLYLRDTAAGHEQTISLDSPEAGCTVKCKGTSQPIFQIASADDSRIFFTDSRPLTQSSGASDLYECLIEEDEEGELHCRLSDLTPQPGAEEAGVLGLVAGASEEGTSIYFTANGRLSTEANARGEAAVAGSCKGNTQSSDSESVTAPQRCNLYERSGGQTRLVAVLSGADSPDWSLGGHGLRSLSDRSSPDGRYLAFMSRRALSGYDNRDAVSGKPDQEVFLYDSSAGGGQGALTCASCDPSGARPHGVPYKQIDTAEGGLSGGSRIWPAGAWIAAIVPGWRTLSEVQGLALYQPRYLSNSGRVLFNSADALVPQDTNSNMDVYEYEPAATGGCNGKRESFSPASGGCAEPISSGTAKEESVLLDASESGDDIFFLTGQRLLPSQDLDTSLDVYDAHACSAASPCLPEAPTPPPACEGDACQSPGAPPEDQTPGSLTYQGPGNPASSPSSSPVVIVKAKTKKPVRCVKGKKLSHGKCVKHAKTRKKRTARRKRTG